jgi:hypothetical protein
MSGCAHEGVGSVGSVRAVEPDDGVEVDQAAPLVFGDLAVGEACLVGELADLDPGPSSELPAQPHREALPENPGVRLPQHGAEVVVGVGVEGGADAGVGVVVVLPAAAGNPPATAGGALPVDGSEAGGGEGYERPRLGGDGVGDALGAADESGADEVEGVGGVAVGAGRADRGAPVAAGGEVLPAVVMQHPPGRGVLQLVCAAEPDGAGAAVDGVDLGAPILVVGGVGAVGDAVVQRQHGWPFCWGATTKRGTASASAVPRSESWRWISG